MRLTRRTFAIAFLAVVAAVSSLLASIPASVAGRVTASHNGQPLANVQINVYDAAGDWVTSSPTDGNGDYTLNGLPEGTYYLSTWNAQGYVDQAWNGVVCASCWPLQNGTPLVVPAGGLTNVDFILALGGRISGRITDAGGAPLANIHVQVHSLTGFYAGGGMTDGNGDYLTTAMPAGSYRVRTYNTQGYLDEAFDNLPCYSCTTDVGALVVVAEPATTGNINFSLDPGGQFAGRVTDAASQPLPGVSITVLHADGTVAGGGHTDANGEYLTSSVPPGSYRIKTWNAFGYIDEAFDDIMCVNCDPVTGTPIAMAGVATVGNIDFSLASGGQIRATITADGGGPLPGVHVQIYSAAGVPIGGQSTDGNGITNDGRGLPAGTYYVRTFNSLGYVDEVFGLGPCMNCQPTLGTPIVVSIGNTTDIALSLGLGNRIVGRVTSSTGTPLEGVWVNADVANGGRGAATAADGTYDINGLPDGTYHLRTFNQLGYVDQVYGGTECGNCPPLAGAPIVVAGATTFTAVDFALNAGGSIAGIVTGAGGLPLSGITVSAYDALGAWNGTATTDAAGAYAIANLRVGSYFVRTSNSLGYVDELHNNITCSNCSTTTGTPVPVSAGGTAFVNFSLTEGGTISGVITDSGGTALQFISVNAYAVGNPNVPVAFAGTNAAGQFTTSGGLPPGQYFLRTFNNAGYIDEVFDNIACAPSCSIANGTPVTVTAGGQTVANFSLVLGGRIGGTVTGATGPLAGVNLSIYTSAGVSITGTNTNASGQYLVGSALAPGQYFVRTFNAPGHINELYNDIACAPSCTVTTGTPVTVTGGGTTTADFALTASAAIEGTVTAVGGAPLSSISVQLYSSTGTFIRSANTDANGFYRLGTDMTAGTYYVRTSNSLGYLNEVWNNVNCHPSCTVTTGTPIVLGAGATVTANFELTQGMVISGTVTRSDTSAPVGSAGVQLLNAAGQTVTSTGTNASGQYSILAAPGTYYVRTSAPIAAGLIDQMHSGVQCVPSCPTSLGTPVSASAVINFALNPQAILTGRVTDGTNGLNGVTVQAYASTGVLLRSTNTATVGGVTGVYTIDRLVTGPVLVRTQNSSGYLDEAHDNIPCVSPCAIALVGATPVAMTQGASTTIDFALARLGSISGVVTDAGSGLPIVGATVRVYSTAGAQLPGGTITDATGTYTLQGLQTGSYYVQAASGNPAWPGAFGYVAEMYDDVECAGCSPLLGAPVATVVGGVTSGINFTLNRGTQISGEVRIGGAPATSGSVGFFNSIGRLVGSTTVDGSGLYTSRDGFSAGTFFARATSAGALQGLYDGLSCFPSCVSTAGTPIVTAGGGVPVSGINFNLTAGGVITGTVLRDGVAPPSGMNLLFYDAQGRQVGSAIPTTTGTYQSVGLATGQYWVLTANSNGTINQVYGGGTCLGCDVLAQGTPVTVTAGATTSAIDFTLTAGGRFSGTVTTTSGVVLQGIAVQVVSGSTVISQSTTGSNGTFTTGPGLPAGTYTVRTLNNLGYWNAQQNADIVGTATTSGLLFQLDVDIDSDGDGIRDSIDRVAATGADESATPSNQFSDVVPGGLTSGSIVDRGGWGVTVADQVLGVRLDVSGAGTSPVMVDVCGLGAAEQVRLASAGDAVTVTCNAVTGSTTLRVIQSTGIVELRKTIEGVTTVIQLTSGQGVTFGSPVTAESDNLSPIVVLLLDEDGDVIGSLTLAPGESVDTSVVGGILTVSVLAGNVTMTVLGETVTVYQSTSANFTLPVTSVTPARMRAQGHWDQAAKQKLHLVFDGRVDASGTGSGSLAVWATGGGKPLGRFESTSVTSATFTPAGSGGTMVMTGAGSIGKQTGYTFAITVTDGGAGQDTVSVTVTNAQGVVVYQGSGPLAGGSVQLLPN